MVNAIFVRIVTGQARAGLFLIVAIVNFGCGTVSNSSTVQTTSLTVSITSPASFAIVFGAVNVVAIASATATSVQFIVDGKNAGSIVLPPTPFKYSLDTTTLANGTHTLAAIASNGSGQAATSAAISISVNNSTLPTISITSPAAGAVVSGSVSVVATVSTNTASVQFKVDGQGVGSPVTAAPFTFALNTAPLVNGSHTLTGVASDSGGQKATSAVVSINVNNPVNKPPLQITTSVLPNGQAGVAYSVSLQAKGGTPPYKWSVTNGQLPTDLTLSSTGMIAGIPALAGTSSLSVGVSDAAGLSTSSVFSITIDGVTNSSAPFGHVIVVVEENTNYSDVIGSASAPYLNGLANQYGLATQYYASSHPSIGNYFALTSGQTLTNDDSQTPLTFPVSVDNVVRELVAAVKTWKAYAESIPSAGYVGGDMTGPDAGQFYTRHVPLPFMTDVQNSSTQRQNIVPFTQFAFDLAGDNLPSYSFITPNGCHDAHDCSLSVADTWLKNNIDPLIKNATFQKDGLLVIVFDESSSDDTNGGGHVAAVLVSPFSKPGFKSSTLYQHPSVLRLMLEGLGVNAVPAPASAAPKMWEFFNFTPPN